MLNYGLVAGKNTTTRSRIRWSADDSTLYFDGRALRVKDWIQFLEDVLVEAEGILSKRLLFRSDGGIPEMDLNTTDDPSNHEAGHYFVFDRQDALKNARGRMMENLGNSDGWNKIVEVQGDGLNFLKAGVDEYETWDNKFRELLAILMMISCGLSGRGTEMTSLRYMNTMEGDRSIYIEDGQVMFVTEYHKSMALMDDVKVVHQ